MSSKTPVTQLQELCTKRKHGPPIYNLTTDGSNEPSKPAGSSNSNGSSSAFVYQVEAFGQLAAGQGKNKREAKHDAAVNILNQLRQLPEFADVLTQAAVGQLSIPRSSLGDDGADAVGTLLDICVQRDYPIASFVVQQAYGAAHAPEFRVECRVASIVRVGTFSTKKRAKQIAAQAMLDVINALPMDEHQQQIATRAEEMPERHMKTYREVKKLEVSCAGVKLCDRHKFFRKLEEPDQAKWRHIFYAINETACEKVHMLCRAMGWKVVVKPVEGHPDHRMRLFELHGCNYDVALAGVEPDLYDEVLEYFRDMSGLRPQAG